MNSTYSTDIGWWAYIHINGSLQIKRYFSERDIDVAVESPFVERIFQPIKASSREEAHKHFVLLMMLDTVEKD